MSPDSGPPGWWTAAFVIFVIAFVVVLILGIGTAVARVRMLRKGGLNPLMAEEQLEVLAAQRLRQDATARNEAATEQPPKSVEKRLAELDDLAERGVISAEERAEARAKILASG